MGKDITNSGNQDGWLIFEGAYHGVGWGFSGFYRICDNFKLLYAAKVNKSDKYLK